MFVLLLDVSGIKFGQEFHPVDQPVFDHQGTNRQHGSTSRN
jgi:hypothetical protein